MRKMALVEQAVLDRLRQKQIIQAIQQPELASMANIKAQIEETLNNSKLSDSEKLEILHRAEDRYDKIQESIGPKTLKTEIVQPELAETALSSVMLPAQYGSKFSKFKEIVSSMPSLIKKSPQNEMIIEGRTIPGSKFDDLIKHLYVPNRNLNLTGINELSAALLKASIKPNLISNKTYKQQLYHAKAQPSHSFLGAHSVGPPHPRSPSPSPSSSPPPRMSPSQASWQTLTPQQSLLIPSSVLRSSAGPRPSRLAARFSQSGKGHPPGKRPRILKLYH